MSRASENGAVICLAEVVELLKQEGEKYAGQPAGLIAYAALTRIKGQALAFGVPLADVGLDGYDIDRRLLGQA